MRFYRHRLHQDLLIEYSRNTVCRFFSFSKSWALLLYCWQNFQPRLLVWYIMSLCLLTEPKPQLLAPNVIVKHVLQEVFSTWESALGLVTDSTIDPHGWSAIQVSMTTLIYDVYIHKKVNLVLWLSSRSRRSSSYQISRYPGFSDGRLITLIKVPTPQAFNTKEASHTEDMYCTKPSSR